MDRKVRQLPSVQPSRQPNHPGNCDVSLEERALFAIHPDKLVVPDEALDRSKDGMDLCAGGKEARRLLSSSLIMPPALD